ncbi:hypothetical protein K491DRAFT_710200 [Lophiostoma macrostomum CBS 122681]|uniref:Uncharacterized protein n=1 Tax=Lophiostoma macrostomum CBS 122681 TaxID=1314788 RepID=A0A6A6TS38_9PLEO|nr:hypothetical protein K491DRAFT_710200 [Lophiostoma macrostomum CBS 122681]
MELWRNSTSPGLASARSSSSAQASPGAIEWPAVPVREDIWKALTSLDGLWVRTLLLQISDSQSRVAWEIWQEYQKQKARKRRRTCVSTKSYKRRVDESWLETERRNHDPSEVGSWDDLGFQAADQEEGSFVAGSVSQSNAGDFASPSIVGDAATLRKASEVVPQRYSAAPSNEQDLTPQSSTSPQDSNRRANAGPPGLSLDDECRQISFVMTKEHRHKSDESQRAVSPEVYKEVAWVIDRIREYACSREADFDNRKKSMETLRNVGETICSAEGTLGEEVRKKFITDPCLEGAMVDILMLMDPIELEAMANVDDSRSRFHEKLTELCLLGREHGIFQDLTEVVKVIRGEEDVELRTEEPDRNPSLMSPRMQLAIQPAVEGARSIIEQRIFPRPAPGTDRPQSIDSQCNPESPTVLSQSLVRASPILPPRSFGSLGKQPLSVHARSPNFRSHGTPEVHRPHPRLYSTQSNEAKAAQHPGARLYGQSHVQPPTARANAASFLPKLFGSPS